MVSEEVIEQAVIEMKTRYSDNEHPFGQGGNDDLRNEAWNILEEVTFKRYIDIEEVSDEDVQRVIEKISR